MKLNLIKDYGEIKLTLLADDGLTSEGNDGATHTRQSENLSNGHIPKSFDQE